MAIFQKSVIKKHLNNLDKEQVEKAYLKFKSNYNPAKIEQIKTLKEEEYQDGFLRDIFVDVFGYTLRPDENYDLQREFKNQSDGKKADAAILKDGKAIAVIELKSTKTKDLTKVTQQAFNYKNNQPECKYVITSNFQKLRFYIDYANEYEEFDLFYLEKEDFKLLYLLLNKNSIFDNIPLKLKEETKFHEQEVSSKLYKDYSHFKRKLYENLTKNHPESDKLTLFKKSQKLLDRFLFILFAEDSGLLPPNSISRVIDTYHKLIDLDAKKPLYDIFKQYFGYLNTGRKGKTSSGDIPAYNGGLFYKDDLLDNLKIDDNILIEDLRNLSEYDFNTEIDVNILGHIFEHSLNDIEEITAEIEGTTVATRDLSPLKISKRKKDGVFYTPKYITQYIVENTVGTLCNEKRIALNIEEIEFDGTYRTKSGKLSEKGKKLYNRLKEYKEWLISLKIIDPACGSGAFLNQALNFLIEEHTIIDDIIAELTNTPLRLFDVDKSILENNLFGVDINEESVEIAQLSLWLRTAQKGRKLSNLNNNIKCGNSLIDDPEIAGDKAFDWNTEFKDIMDNGGFDCVIGNPPYVSKAFSEIEKRYFNSEYSTAQYQLDLYISFMELGVNILKNEGLLSFIVPNSWLKNLMFDKSRLFFLNNLYFDTIIPNLENVFVDASVDTLIFVASKSKLFNSEIEIGQFKHANYQKKHFVNQNRFIDNDKMIFDVEISEESESIFKKIKKHCVRLSEIADITRGINPYDKYRGQTADVIKNKLYHSNYKKDETFVPEIRGKHVNRYSLEWDGKSFVSYGDWLAAPREQRFFEGNRIICRQVLGTNLNCTFIDSNFIIDQSVFIAKFDKEQCKRINPKFVLTQLTSKLLSYYFRYKANEFDALFPKIKIGEYKQLPIKEISQEAQQPFIEKADKMLTLNQELQSKSTRFIKRITDNFEIEKISKKLSTFYNYDFKTFVAELKKQKVVLSLKQQDEWQDYFDSYKTEINQLQNEIQQTDNEIDKMVYKLYGLSDEEIGIIEKSV
ncbi:MAG: N-6 DNA methylase [Bacteroidetes bacterium]|nr:N-6 DNA methylase [Bacteroidota bacterium]